MKTAVICVLFHTPLEEKKRLQNEIAAMAGVYTITNYFIDHSGTENGYAEGVNKGIKKGLKEGAEIFIILNPDISINKFSLSKMFESKKSFDIWGFAMRQGTNTYYGGEIDKWRMSGGLVRRKPLTRFIKSDYVSGSCMVISKKVIERIGYFDERYGMYYEDVDFCYRARLAGFRVGIDSSLMYDHFETSDVRPEKKVYLAVNRIKFMFKFGSLRQKLRELLRAPLTLWEERKAVVTKFTMSIFLKNFISLNLSSLINKALHFLLFLVLIRVLSVKNYGIYTLVWAHVTILSPLVDFGTTSYGLIYLPKEKERMTNALFSLRLALSGIVFILTFLLALFFGYGKTILWPIFFVSFVIFHNMTSGMYFILSSIKEEMTKTAFISVLCNVFMIVTLIMTVFVAKRLDFLFLIIGLNYLLLSFIYFSLIKTKTRKLTLVFPLRDWVSIIKKSYVFVLIGLFAGIYFKIDVFILNFLKGPSAVGIYSSGYKFLEAMTLVASSYNTLSAPVFAKTALKKRSFLFEKIAKHMILLGTVGFGAALITMVFGPFFLPYILKGNFTQGIEVVTIVIWALPFILFNSIYLNLLYVSGLPHIAILIFISAAIINLVLNTLFVPTYSYIASSYITIASEVITLCVLLLLTFVVFRKKIFYD